MSTTPLSDRNLIDLLDLVKDADSVELKLTVPDAEIAVARQNVQLDLLDGQIRQVVFFDTPDLALNGGGVVVRARRIQGGAAIPS